MNVNNQKKEEAMRKKTTKLVRKYGKVKVKRTAAKTTEALDLKTVDNMLALLERLIGPDHYHHAKTDSKNT